MMCYSDAFNAGYCAGYGKKPDDAVAAAAAKLPKSIAALQTAFGLSGPTDGIADDLWLYNVASGNLTSIGDSTVLTATGTNTYEVDISGDFDAGDLAITYDATTDGFDGPDASYGDPGAASLAHLFVFRLDDTVPADRFVMHNYTSGAGTRLMVPSTRLLQWSCDGVHATMTGALTVGQWYSALMWFEPSTEVGLAVEGESATDTVGVPASVTSAATWGLPGAGGAPDMTIALAATFTGASADALRAAQHTAFSTNAGLT